MVQSYEKGCYQTALKNGYASISNIPI